MKGNAARARDEKLVFLSAARRFPFFSSFLGGGEGEERDGW